MKGVRKKFKARLGGEDAGDIPLVEIPFDVKETFGKARPPVIVSFKKFSFRTTISVYGGKSYIGLRREVREAAGVELGERIDFTIEADTTPRTVAVPKDLTTALKKSNMTDQWKKLSFTHQKEHVKALEDAKKPETRARRVEKTIGMLKARKV